MRCQSFMGLVAVEEPSRFWILWGRVYLLRFFFAISPRASIKIQSKKYTQKVGPNPAIGMKNMTVRGNSSGSKALPKGPIAPEPNSSTKYIKFDSQKYKWKFKRLLPFSLKLVYRKNCHANRNTNDNSRLNMRIWVPSMSSTMFKLLTKNASIRRIRLTVHRTVGRVRFLLGKSLINTSPAVDYY